MERTETNHGKAWRHCLDALLTGIGWRGDADLLLEVIPGKEDDMTADDLLRIMATLRMDGSVAPTYFDAINPKACPCIFVADGFTPSVVLAIDGTRAFVFDGATRSYSYVPLRPIQGLSFTFRRLEPSEPSPDDRQPDWFTRIFARFRILILLALFSALCVAVLAIFSPVLVATIFGQLSASVSAHDLGRVAIGIGIYLAASAGAALI